MERITDFLSQRKQAKLLRTLNSFKKRSPGRIYYNGTCYVDFCSNDYLGLSTHSQICETIQEAVKMYGTGNCASRLLSGDHELFHILEEKVAHLKGKEASLVFNSGYQANIGIISSLYGKKDVIFADKLVHASIIDGAILSGAKLIRFRHNDSNHLEELLHSKRVQYNNALIVTESIFSMDGDKAPLQKIVKVKDKFHCELLVDEAHATGIFGENGSGVVQEQGVVSHVDFIMGTFSKALGGFGAYVACSSAYKEYFVNACRSFVYSTSLPPSVILGNFAALETLDSEPQRRIELLSLVDYMKEQLQSIGINILGESQIIPIEIGSLDKLLTICESLKESKYWVLPVRPPTVPVGRSRIRLSLCYGHKKEDIDGFVKTLKTIL